MKLILSRKGFDSANGGCPSPIIDDDLLCSLPIPDDRAPVRYRNISFNGARIGATVESLTRGRIAAGERAHLDPDLRRDAIRRPRGWRPIFGQAGAAQTHLARQKVGVGDLFLFFGAFRRAESGNGKTFRFVRSAPKLHVIFGWLHVGEVHAVTDGLKKEIPWARRHPHLAAAERRKNDTVYIASERLSSLNLDASGAGIFERLRPELTLTATEPYAGCSTWTLPRWMHPGARTPLSYHSKLTRWIDCETSVRLQSAYPGQEFVLDLEEYPEAYEWLIGIFGGSKGARA
jgi:Nucleotide modification associated domain 3